jgi:hypothetical protein
MGEKGEGNEVEEREECGLGKNWGQNEIMGDLWWP